MQTTTEAVKAALDVELGEYIAQGGILHDDFPRFARAVLERLHDGAATVPTATPEAVQAALEAELMIARRSGGIVDDDFGRFTAAVLERLHDGAAVVPTADVDGREGAQS